MASTSSLPRSFDPSGGWLADRDSLGRLVAFQCRRRYAERGGANSNSPGAVPCAFSMLQVWWPQP